MSDAIETREAGEPSRKKPRGVQSQTESPGSKTQRLFAEALHAALEDNRRLKRENQRLTELCKRLIDNRGRA